MSTRPGKTLWSDWLLFLGWTILPDTGPTARTSTWRDKDGKEYDFTRAKEIQEGRDAE
jgi:hypothetical protein